MANVNVNPMGLASPETALAGRLQLATLNLLIPINSQPKKKLWPEKKNFWAAGEPIARIYREVLELYIVHAS